MAQRFSHYCPNSTLWPVIVVQPRDMPPKPLWNSHFVAGPLAGAGTSSFRRTPESRGVVGGFDETRNSLPASISSRNCSDLGGPVS